MNINSTPEPEDEPIRVSPTEQKIAEEFGTATSEKLERLEQLYDKLNGLVGGHPTLAVELSIMLSAQVLRAGIQCGMHIGALEEIVDSAHRAQCKTLSDALVDALRDD